MPGAWRSLRPRLYVPARVRSLLPVAAAVFLATWAAGAFYQAFVPAPVEDQLHTSSPLIVGLVFAAYMGPSVLGAPLGGRFAPATAQRVGMIGFLTGMIGIVTAITTGTLVLFIAATIVAGASQGIAISAATPALIAGQLSNTFSLPQIALGYGALALVATLFTAIGAHNPRTDATGNSQHGE